MTDQDRDDRELARHLHRLAERLDSPDVPVGDDLQRGRRRMARRRLSVGAAGAATAAVLAVGAFAVPGLTGEGRADPAGDGSTPSGPDVTPPVAPGETDLPKEGTSTAPAGPDGFPQPPESDRGLLVSMRRAVAGHLDPQGTHISDREIRMPNESGSFGADTWSSIVQKIGWQNPGEDGLGLVSVGVASSFDVDCGGHGPAGPTAECTETDLAGTPVTRVDDVDAGTSFHYRRPDGYVTSIQLDTLYGNNSTVPVSRIDVTDAQLAAVLTDPVLDLPGDPDPVTVDVLAGTELRDVARDVLGRARISEESWAGQLGGYWSAYVDGYRVQLEDGQGNFAIDAPCRAWFATRCAERVVDGMRVRIDYRRNRTGGGYDVTVAGPARAIWVYVPADGSDAVPVDVALELATDPRLQR